MCKFTNRLFVFALLGAAFYNQLNCLANNANDLRNVSDPGRAGLLEMLYADYNDFNVEEVHYDQRQKGEENLKIKLDGFFVSLPTPSESYLNDLFTMELIGLLSEPKHKSEKSNNAEEYVLVNEAEKLPNIESHIQIQHNQDNNKNNNNNDKYNVAVTVKPTGVRQYDEFINADDLNNASRTKAYMLRLFNMLKRARRY